MAAIYHHEVIGILTSYKLDGARMVSDCAKTDCSILVHHSFSDIALHYLVLHHCQLLCHLHRLVFVIKHASLHFGNYELSTFNILMSPSDVFFELFYFGTLFILERLKLVSLLDESIAGRAHLIKFVICLYDLLITLRYGCSFLIVGSPDLS